MRDGGPGRLAAAGVGFAVLLFSSPLADRIGLETPGSAPGARGADLPGPVESCSLPKDRFRDVTALLARWTDRKRQLEDVPGLVLGLACGPDVNWTRGFGMADREAGRVATDTTPFRIASVTKVFTALAVLKLRDENRLGLDDRVSKHLSWFELDNSDEMPAVTIRHLLTHTSGLPTNSVATDFNRLTQPMARQLRAVLPDQRLLFAPGADENYSNLGFAVLGQVIESVSGKPYRDYVASELFGPLGLERTTAHPLPDLPQARGYHLRRPGLPRRPADFLHLAAFTPAGGMATTATDMVRFLSFLLAPERNPDVIAPETLREMQEVHHWVDSARGGSGLAWAVEKNPGTHEIYHGGGLPTQTSHLRVDLRHGLGVIVLANTEDADPAAYAREALALLRRAADTARVEDAAPSGANPPTGELGRYTGRYRFHERELWVMETAGALSLVRPIAGRPSRTFVRLEPSGGHRFRLGGSVLGGGAEGQPVEFVVDETGGEVLRVQLPNVMYLKAGMVRP